MSFRLSCRIQIGAYIANFANSVEIASSWRDLTDTCIIKMPSKGVLRRTDVNQEVFKFEDRFAVGMPVTVQLGYDGQNVTEFVGYVARIVPKVPFEIHCEDESWQLKRAGVITAAYSGTIKGLLNKYLTGVKLSDSIPEINLKNFVLNKVTRAQMLQELKDKYLLTAYYRGQELFVGLPYSEPNTNVVRYDFERNIRKDSVGNLSYLKETDVKIKVKAVSFLSNNTKIEVEVGDPDGEQRTLNTYGLTSEKGLKSWAEEQLTRLKYEGYRGDFEGFGQPFCRHSDTVDLTDPRYPERSGRYVVDKVTVNWRANGFSRKVEIGKKVSL